MSMRFLINIPKEFVQHFQADRFENSLRRLNSDAHFMAGLYEQETAEMLIDAFKNAVPVPTHGRLIDANALKVFLTFAEETAEWTVPVLRTVLMAIDEMPTIISAEEGEE